MGFSSEDRRVYAHGSARAEYILKCNTTPSSLLLFLPPWLFFTVFKGMFLLPARLLRPRVPGPALISLGPRRSLPVGLLTPSLRFPRARPRTLSDARAARTPARRSPSSCRRTPGLFPGIALPSALAARRGAERCPSASPAPLQPGPLGGRSLCRRFSPPPVHPSFPIAELVCPDFSRAVVHPDPAFWGSSPGVLVPPRRRSCLLCGASRRLPSSERVTAGGTSDSCPRLFRRYGGTCRLPAPRPSAAGITGNFLHVRTVERWGGPGWAGPPRIARSSLLWEGEPR